MPYRSRAQQRWAHATGQPFAAEWDEKTKRVRRGRKKGFAALPEKVGKAMSSWGENAAVGKAFRDHEGAVGVGTALAGAGVIRGGAEINQRFKGRIKAQDAQTALLQRRAAAAHANADARKGKRGEYVRPPAKPGSPPPAVTRHIQTTAQQRDWAANLDQGAKASARRGAALRRVAPTVTRNAARTKLAGLGLVALGGALGLKGAADASARRQEF